MYNLKDKSLSFAFRLRSTIAKKIQTANQRVLSSAVTEEDQLPDFICPEQIDSYSENQCDLRSVKTQTALKSLQTEVMIPAGIPVKEEGTLVPVYHAVLIRDDMKSRKNLLDQILNIPTTSSSRMLSLRAEPQEKIKKVRNFNFDEVLKESENLQEAIDIVDGIIQGTDATTKFK